MLNFRIVPSSKHRSFRTSYGSLPTQSPLPDCGQQRVIRAIEIPDIVNKGRIGATQLMPRGRVVEKDDTCRMSQALGLWRLDEIRTRLRFLSQFLPRRNRLMVLPKCLRRSLRR